jgi:hypothetical protein
MANDNHLNRVRRMCLAMPEATEKLSHGAPTFFGRKGVFAAFWDNHHGNGHISVVIPAPLGHQEMLIATSPKTYYRPPYVGVKGWVGIDLDQIDDEELMCHIREAWQLISAKAKRR